MFRFSSTPQKSSSFQKVNENQQSDISGCSTEQLNVKETPGAIAKAVLDSLDNFPPDFSDEQVLEVVFVCERLCRKFANETPIQFAGQDQGYEIKIGDKTITVKTDCGLYLKTTISCTPGNGAVTFEGENIFGLVNAIISQHFAFSTRCQQAMGNKFPDMDLQEAGFESLEISIHQYLSLNGFGSEIRKEVIERQLGRQDAGNMATCRKSFAVERSRDFLASLSPEAQLSYISDALKEIVALYAYGYIAQDDLDIVFTKNSDRTLTPILNWLESEKIQSADLAPLFDRDIQLCIFTPTMLKMIARDEINLPDLTKDLQHAKLNKPLHQRLFDSASFCRMLKTGAVRLDQVKETSDELWTCILNDDAQINAYLLSNPERLAWMKEKQGALLHLIDFQSNCTITESVQTLLKDRLITPEQIKKYGIRLLALSKITQSIVNKKITVEDAMQIDPAAFEFEYLRLAIASYTNCTGALKKLNREQFVILDVFMQVVPFDRLSRLDFSKISDSESGNNLDDFTTAYGVSYDKLRMDLIKGYPGIQVRAKKSDMLNVQRYLYESGFKNPTTRTEMINGSKDSASARAEIGARYPGLAHRKSNDPVLWQKLNMKSDLAANFVEDLILHGMIGPTDVKRLLETSFVTLLADPVLHALVFSGATRVEKLLTDNFSTTETEIKHLKNKHGTRTIEVIWFP